MKEIIGANLDFGFRLFAEISRREVEKNILVSPLSIALALAIVYSGARGGTKQAIMEVLQIHGMELDDLKCANASLLAILTNPDPNVHVNIANAIWADKDVRFKQTFLTKVGSYGVEIVNFDLHDPDAVDAINDWVSRKTQRKISDIADKSVIGAILLILNAIYFKGAWRRAFEKSETCEKTFILPNGMEKKHPLMFQEGYYKYYRAKDFQAISLPYGYGRMSMYVFLPDVGLEGFHKILNLKNWNHWMTSFREMRGVIGIPRFKVEYSTNLEEILTVMGMGVAFDEKRADFGDMIEDSKIWLDRVKHSTYLRVDEEGSEAAAATKVVLKKKEPPSEQTFTMIANRPFFFAIRDNDTGAVLFMGSIVDPEDVET